MSYYVRAKDAAGNQSANSNTVTRTGTGGRRHQPGRRQADHRLRSTLHASSPANANDNNVDHLLGGRGGATRAR